MYRLHQKLLTNPTNQLANKTKQNYKKNRHNVDEHITKLDMLNTKIGKEEETFEDEKEEEPSVVIDTELRLINLFGPVNPKMSFVVWMALQNLLKDSTDEEITLILNSMGGHVHDMFSIVDAMRICQAPIKIIGTGIIASAATLILAAGTKGKRYLTSNCMVMTHDLSWGYYTNLTELQQVATVGKDIEARYHKLMSKFTGRKLSDIKPYLIGQGNWFFPKEAITKIGLADHIINPGNK